MVLLTAVLTVRTGVLQPVFLGVEDYLTDRIYYLEALLWKVVPARSSFPNAHTEHTASS
jgi:hypothetical protein